MMHLCVTCEYLQVYLSPCDLITFRLRSCLTSDGSRPTRRYHLVTNGNNLSSYWKRGRYLMVGMTNPQNR